MTDGRAVRDESPEPAPTWGSALNIASGLTSAEYDAPATEAQSHRVLEMQPSPDVGGMRDGRRRPSGTQGSSPVESFTSPAKASQITEIDSLDSQRRGTARLGTWELPEEDEQAAIEVEIDPNGDDDEIAAQVTEFVARERETKRKRQQEESISSSHPSQANMSAAATTSSHVLRNSTPPPARLKRPRRGHLGGDGNDAPISAVEAAVVSTPVEEVPRKVAEEELDVSKLATPMAIVNNSYGEASCYAICQYVKASPLIPGFLKDEIVRCVSRSSRSSQSLASTSDSDTQEDGFLKTKPFWIFELMRMEANSTIVAGKNLKSRMKPTDLTLVLQIFSDTYSYGTQLVEQGPLIMSRNEIRSNPWFDGSGHPYSIVLERPANQDGYASDGSPLNSTQSSTEQLSLLRRELEQVSRERDLAVTARSEAERNLQSVEESNSLAQENYEFLRGEYGVASNMAAELVKTNRELTEQVDALKAKLSEGMQAVRAVSQNQVTTLQHRLSVAHSQLDLLKQQNKLTNNDVREKAGKWDAYQAKERIRKQELERRKAEVDAQRAAQYGAMQDEDRKKRAADLLKAPHELMLEVDLTTQKELLPGDNEEDELAMLRAEAEAATGSIVDINAPRSRRGRPSRVTQAGPVNSSIGDTVAADTLKDNAVHQDHGSQAAMMGEAADILQGELEYQALQGAYNE